MTIPPFRRSHEEISRERLGVVCLRSSQLLNVAQYSFRMKILLPKVADLLLLVGNDKRQTID